MHLVQAGATIAAFPMPQPNCESELRSELSRRIMVIDGAMGTMVQRYGLDEAVGAVARVPAGFLCVYVCVFVSVDMQVMCFELCKYMI